MTMPLFKRIIDQIASSDVSVLGPISFGLFGDGLVDPHVLERAKYVRKRIPFAYINVNTNGAAYSRRKHQQLRETVSSISLHIESLDPLTYNRLMAPLKLNHVLPKCIKLAKDFGKQLSISVPVSRANYLEKAEIESFFLDRGAGHVIFTPIMNRCSDNPVFTDLAFSPRAMTCRSDLLADLIIDWAGDVFACCQDFAKQMQVGDLSRQDLSEMLNSPQRKALGEMLDAGRWNELPACSHCQFDCWNSESGKEEKAAIT
jgi:radical SAM protein with 4Fe4S-binding SPASM domain